MLPPEIFESLRTVMSIFVLFQQLLRQVLLKFFALNFEFFTKYRCDAFCSHIFDLCVLKDYCYRGGSKLQKKIYSSKTLLKWLVHSPHPPLPPALEFPGTILLSPRLKWVTF